jgi:hypothetical protein
MILNKCIVDGGMGWGLAPAHGLMNIAYDHKTGARMDGWRGSFFLNIMAHGSIEPCDPSNTNARGYGLNLAVMCFSPRSYDPMCPRAWRLGAGGALIVLQFGPVFGYVRG